MHKWIVRTDTCGHTIAHVRVYATEHAIAREPGILCVDEALALMLSDGETIDGEDRRRTIRRGEHVTGWIEILEFTESNWKSTVKGP